MNILIVDDTLLSLKLLRVELEAENFKVFEAADGVQALEVLARERIDAIISDILMPRMDGYRLCHEVRILKEFQNLPFLFYTSTYTSPSDEKFALEIGGDKFLRKPASAREILDALHEITRISARPSVKSAKLTKELQVLREYSERLVAKLEQKNIELSAQNTLLAMVQARVNVQAVALETAASAILITDASGVIEWVNPAFVALTGYSVREVVGKTPSILKSGEHDPAFYKEFWSAISSGQVWRGEFTNRRKDGSIYYDEHTVTPIRSANGDITHYVGIMHDVTERKRAKQELQVSNEQLKHLLAHSPAVLYRVKLEGGTFIPTTVSQNITRLLGFEVAEVLSYEWWLSSLHPLDQSRVLESIKATLNEGISRTEYRVRHKKGNYRWIEDHRRVVRDDSGQPVQVIGVWTDITERKQLEAQLCQAQKLEAMGTLAGGIAHDFNNILGALNGYAELARLESEENPKALDYLREVSSAGQRATELVKQILAFSRRQEQERKPIHLRHVLREAVKLLRASVPAMIEFKSELSPDAPVVLADSTQIHQVLMNLGTNAWHAMRGTTGMLRIVLSPFAIEPGPQPLHPALQPGKYARVEVTDTGPGMEQAVLDRIFEPFYTTKGPGEGTGLGLAVVYGIMQKHDGVITVESVPGKGTTFCLYFPAHATEPAREPIEITAKPRGRGEKILFVDDEIGLVQLSKNALTRLGYEAHVTTNPAEALRWVQANPRQFDLVITDLSMPGMTGIDLARKLLLINPGLPILLTSGYTASLTLDQIKAAGIRDLLQKPASVNALGQAVHRHLPHPALESQPRPFYETNRAH